MITIVYAHRNRDTKRIEVSFKSLQQQKLQNFEVIFVDYGSERHLVKDLETLSGQFDFVKFFHLPVSQLLWNKSKGLNYGIKKASGDYIFIADIDLVFHPETTKLLEQIKSPAKFQLFKLGYLGKGESKTLSEGYKFEVLKAKSFGGVNGMILTSRESLFKIDGLDEFFHFYGAEDEDLFARLENIGLKREHCEKSYFIHQWHQSFSGSEDKLLTGNPRVKNIKRINQRHFLQNREKGVVKPLRQIGMGEIINPVLSRKLKRPDLIVKTPNVLAHVEHLLREELPSLQNKVIRIEFFEAVYYSSLKHRIKKLLGKQTQPYISMKEVNDMVLKEILFNYRDHNYSFRINEDLKNIVFCIQV
ncbi:glycosyltransferase family 2 protein [Salinimicrobium sp. 3283s]|uniref:glycosyltransferase family 2 protein n=1 Tax=Salinimicrobium sp. 3283s TaxID=3114359 RepID=UPI0031E7B6B6